MKSWWSPCSWGLFLLSANLESSDIFIFGFGYLRIQWFMIIIPQHHISSHIIPLFSPSKWPFGGWLAIAATGDSMRSQAPRDATGRWLCYWKWPFIVDLSSKNGVLWPITHKPTFMANNSPTFPVPSKPPKRASMMCQFFAWHHVPLTWPFLWNVTAACYSHLS